MREGYPDHTALDPNSKYFDAATVENPRWSMVDLAPVATPRRCRLKPSKRSAFEGMLLIRRGQRLSIQPVEEHHFRRVLSLAGFDVDAMMEE